MKRFRKIVVEQRPATTTTGYQNASGQIVVRACGPSPSRPGQRVYEMRCRHCGFQYGCNGIDNERRTCPRCQSGAKGEPLRAPGPGLFDHTA